MRRTQRIAGLIPWVGTTIQANLELYVWNLVSGNSLMSEDKVKKGIRDDIIMGAASSISNPSQYSKDMKNITTAIKMGSEAFDRDLIKKYDKVAWDLMESAGISIYGNNVSELNRRMNFVYGFIEQNKDYFLSPQQSYGITGFEENNVTMYRYQKYMNKIINRPIVAGMDERLINQTMRLRNNTNANLMANEYQQIMGELRQSYWGYWDFPNNEYALGYYQYNININYRVDPYYNK